MPYIKSDLTLPQTPFKPITDEEMHLLIDDEIQRIPMFHGVFVLWDNTGPIFVDTGTLLNAVPVAASKHPTAVYFSLYGLNLTDHRITAQLAEWFRKQYGLTDNPTN
jgi:hypothetical protein